MSGMTVWYARSRARTRVEIADGSLDRLGRFLRGVSGARAAALVSDERVAALYGERSLRSLSRAGVRAALITVPHGERSKRAATLERLWQAFDALRLGRRDAVIALGGGVVGDVAGFAAATWLRGVPWIVVPTTVIAQVDSALGGKTGIDLPSAKNLVGAFHQPLGLLVDPLLLQTLPVRERRAGLAEVVKMGMACDAALFGWVERHADGLAAGEVAALSGAVARALALKARVVQADEHEREGGVRTSLNYGHTLGHALEAAHGYRGLKHGEAVALGMRVAARLSERAAKLAPEGRVRLERVLDRLALPRSLNGTRLADLIRALKSDKKRALVRRAVTRKRGGRKGGDDEWNAIAREVRWVLTPRVGHASVPRLVSGRLLRAVLIEAGARP
ncbi:MAG: 3-dehydroquinate synthase [Candidatus Eiseniibacteriota bacterium]